MDNTFRTMEIYHRLRSGAVVSKAKLAEEFECDPKAIQRSFQDIKEFLASHPEEDTELKYSRLKGGHSFTNSGESDGLSRGEILTLCKILLESRALVKKEMDSLIKKLLERCVDIDDRRHVLEMVNNEKFLYRELQHGKMLVDAVYQLNEAACQHRLIRMKYRSAGKESAGSVLIQPLGVMFSEFYFYLIARKCAGEDQPDQVVSTEMRNYRIDRIDEYDILDIHFRAPYANRFQEGEFRDRIQFMFGGQLRRISFRYVGASIEAVQDRFPNAEVTPEGEKSWKVTAKVYGEGYNIWVRAQGKNVEDVSEAILLED